MEARAGKTVAVSGLDGEQREVDQPNPRPKVEPQEGDVDAQAVRHRESLLKAMTPTMYETVEQEVVIMWDEQRRLAPASVQSLLPAEPPRAHWTET